MRGIGSILDIMPARREKTIFRMKIDKIDKTIMESAWGHVGENISKAIDKYPHDKKKNI